MADTGIPITRPNEPYLIRADGVKLYKYATDNGMKVIQHPSEQRYDEAIDVESATWTYTASDEPIESIEDNEVQQKAEAFDYLTGRSGNDE